MSDDKVDKYILQCARDWSQTEERQPVTEVKFVEYDELDEEGFAGHIAMSIQMGPGRFLEKRFRLNPSSFGFFVSEIAARYGAGGPK